MLELYQYAPTPLLPNPSPFCMKVETFLIMYGLDYRPVATADPRTAPKAKLPYIVDNRTTVADSSEILRYLSRIHQIDDKLMPDEEAHGHLLQRCVEEHLYWCILHERWVTPANWEATRQLFETGQAKIVSKVIPLIVRKKVQRDIKGHGMGLHGRQEIYYRANEDLNIISRCLGDKTYLFGTKPCRFDAVTFPFVANICALPDKSPLKQSLLGYPNLVAYRDRLMNDYFPDFA